MRIVAISTRPESVRDLSALRHFVAPGASGVGQHALSDQPPWQRPRRVQRREVVKLAAGELREVGTGHGVGIGCMWGGVERMSRDGMDAVERARHIEGAWSPHDLVS